MNKPDFLTSKWIELNQLQLNQMIEYCRADHLNRQRMTLVGHELNLPPADFALAMAHDPIEDRQISIAIGIHVDTARLFIDIDRAREREDTGETLVDFLNRVTIGVENGPAAILN